MKGFNASLFTQLVILLATLVLTSLATPECPTVSDLTSVNIAPGQASCFETSNQIVKLNEPSKTINVTARFMFPPTETEFDWDFTNGFTQIYRTYSPRKIFYSFRNTGQENQTFPVFVINNKEGGMPFERLEIFETSNYTIVYPSASSFSSYYYRVQVFNPIFSFYISANGDNSPFLLSFGVGQVWDSKLIVKDANITKSSPYSYVSSSGVDYSECYFRIVPLCKVNCTDITLKFIIGVYNAEERTTFDVIIPPDGGKFFFDHNVDPLTEMTITSSGQVNFDIFASHSDRVFDLSDNILYELDTNNIFIYPNETKRNMKFLIKSATGFSSNKSTWVKMTVVSRPIEVHALVNQRSFRCVSSDHHKETVDYYSISFYKNKLSFAIELQYSDYYFALEEITVTADAGTYGYNPFLIYRNDDYDSLIKYEGVSPGGKQIVIVRRKNKDDGSRSLAGYCIYANHNGGRLYKTKEGLWIAIGLTILFGVVLATFTLFVVIYVLAFIKTKVGIGKVTGSNTEEEPILSEIYHKPSYYTSKSPELKAPLL
ncbi:hypothetical protein AKO1_003654 [Acrasis kona]|uniref:Uncharacterized protein n=1 Tax=Acrasis kona TaxID=1008807 RepID=A0AAW2Z7F6_9EUKA